MPDTPKTWNNGLPSDIRMPRKQTVALQTMRLFWTAQELRKAADYAKVQAQTLRAGLQGDDVTEFEELAKAKDVGKLQILVTWED